MTDEFEELIRDEISVLLAEAPMVPDYAEIRARDPRSRRTRLRGPLIAVGSAVGVVMLTILAVTVSFRPIGSDLGRVTVPIDRTTSEPGVTGEGIKGSGVESMELVDLDRVPELGEGCVAVRLRSPRSGDPIDVRCDLAESGPEQRFAQTRFFVRDTWFEVTFGKVSSDIARVEVTYLEGATVDASIEDGLWVAVIEAVIDRPGPAADAVIQEVRFIGAARERLTYERAIYETVGVNLSGNEFFVATNPLEGRPCLGVNVAYRHGLLTTDADSCADQFQPWRAPGLATLIDAPLQDSLSGLGEGVVIGVVTDEVDSVEVHFSHSETITFAPVVVSPDLPERGFVINFTPHVNGIPTEFVLYDLDGTRLGRIDTRRVWCSAVVRLDPSASFLNEFCRGG